MSISQQISIRTRKKAVLEMVMEEVSILKTLSHEHILVMHGAFQSRNEVIVVTEFLSGGELFEKVATDDYHLTEAECVRFMYQICDAVSYVIVRRAQFKRRALGDLLPMGGGLGKQGGRH